MISLALTHAQGYPNFSHLLGPASSFSHATHPSFLYTPSFTRSSQVVTDRDNTDDFFFGLTKKYNDDWRRK
jgi:hypothetical protein